MYGGDMERWADPFTHHAYHYNDPLDDEGRYISAAAPPPPPGASPSLLFSSPKRIEQLQNLQAKIASQSPTKRGQTSSKLHPSPLRTSNASNMVASGSNIGPQTINSITHREDGNHKNVETVSNLKEQSTSKPEPVIRLYDWYIGLQPTQQALSYYSKAEGVKKWIQIFGVRYRSEEERNPTSKGKRRADDKGEPWHSSLISERISSKLVKSKSGKIYELMGSFDESSARKRKKVSIETAAKFRSGFPTSWADIVCEEARLTQNAKSKPRSPLKRHTNTTNLHNESIDDQDQIEPIKRSDRFSQPTKVQMSPQRAKPRPTLSGKQLPEPKSQPKARKRKSIFKDDDQSSESEYQPSSDGRERGSRGKGRGRRGVHRNLEGEEDFQQISEDEDSMFEEANSKAKANAETGTKDKGKRGQSISYDMVAQDEHMSSRSPSPELDGQVSSLHQMEQARVQKTGQRPRTESRLRTARRSEPVPIPSRRQLSPPSSPAAEEPAKKLKPISRELRNLSKTAFGRLTLVQNAIMEQLEQSRSERKRSGRQSLPSMRTKDPYTPLSQIGDNSSLITPRSSRRTRTPAKSWWEVQPSTKTKPSQPKTTEARKLQLFNITSSSCDEDEAMENTSLGHSRASKGSALEQKRVATHEKNLDISQAPIQISSDDENESEEGEDKLNPSADKNVQDLIEERQIEEHIDLQSSPSHGKITHKRIGDDLLGPIEKRSRMENSDDPNKEQFGQLEGDSEIIEGKDHHMEEQQSDDLQYVDDTFDPLPQHVQGDEPGKEEVGELHAAPVEEQAILQISSFDDSAIDKSNSLEQMNDQEGEQEHSIREAHAELIPAEHQQEETEQDVAEDQPKEGQSSSASERSRSSVSPIASDQNTNETTADPVDIPSPVNDEKQNSYRHSSSEYEKGESHPMITNEALDCQQNLHIEEETAKQADFTHEYHLADFEINAYVNDDQQNTKKIDIVEVEDSDDGEKKIHDTVGIQKVVEKDKRQEKEPSEDIHDAIAIDEVPEKEIRQEKELSEEISMEHEVQQEIVNHLLTKDAQEFNPENEQTQIDVERSTSNMENLIEGERGGNCTQDDKNGTLVDTEAVSQTVKESPQLPLHTSSPEEREKDNEIVGSALLRIAEIPEREEHTNHAMHDDNQLDLENLLTSNTHSHAASEAPIEKPVEVARSSIGMTDDLMPEALHNKTMTSSTAQHGDTPTDYPQYSHLSEREEQEVSVEFEALQIVSKGAGLLLEATDDDLMCSSKVKENAEGFLLTRSHIGMIEDLPFQNQQSISDDRNQTIIGAQVETSKKLFDNDRNIGDPIDAFQHSTIETDNVIDHENLHQIIDPIKDDLRASISPAENNEMDDDNESVVSLSEVYYFSD